MMSWNVCDLRVIYKGLFHLLTFLLLLLLFIYLFTFRNSTKHF